jgi:hypothetical protein
MAWGNDDRHRRRVHQGDIASLTNRSAGTRLKSPFSPAVLKPGVPVCDQEPKGGGAPREGNPVEVPGRRTETNWFPDKGSAIDPKLRIHWRGPAQSLRSAFVTESRRSIADRGSRSFLECARSTVSAAYRVQTG